jgi:hypothetical protein
MRIRLLLAGLAVVMAAGCSSSNHTSPISSSPPSVASTVKSGTDQQVAQAAIMNQHDMGADYLASPYTPSPQDAADDAAFRACLGQPATAKAETATVFSPIFTMDFKVVLGNITFVDSDKTAQAYIAALHDTPKAVSCLKSSTTEQLSRSGGSAQVEVSPIYPSPGGANVDVIAYRLQILSGENGQDPQPVVVDLVSALKGRAEISVHFQDLNQPVPTDIQDHVVRTMLDRLPA